MLNLCSTAYKSSDWQNIVDTHIYRWQELNSCKQLFRFTTAHNLTALLGTIKLTEMKTTHSL